MDTGLLGIAVWWSILTRPFRRWSPVDDDCLATAAWRLRRLRLKSRTRVPNSRTKCIARLPASVGVEEPRTGIQTSSSARNPESLRHIPSLRPARSTPKIRTAACIPGRHPLPGDRCSPPPRREWRAAPESTDHVVSVYSARLRNRLAPRERFSHREKTVREPWKQRRVSGGCDRLRSPLTPMPGLPALARLSVLGS